MQIEKGNLHLMQKILIVEDDPIQLEMLYETVHSRYPA